MLKIRDTGTEKIGTEKIGTVNSPLNQRYTDQNITGQIKKAAIDQSFSTVRVQFVYGSSEGLVHF